MEFAAFEHADVPTPKQRRSEANLQRLLGAARKLLEDCSFDDLSVQRVVDEANCSVGTFYARFADKEALLDCLDELYARDLIGAFETLAEDWSARSPELPTLVDEAARFLVDFHRARCGVVRALILHARLHPSGPFAERTRRMISFTPGILRAFLRCVDAIAHPKPRRAVRFGFVQALTTVREFVLFPEGPAAIQPLSDLEITTEVARSWFNYLTVEGFSP